MFAEIAARIAALVEGFDTFWTSQEYKARWVFKFLSVVLFFVASPESCFWVLFRVKRKSKTYSLKDNIRLKMSETTLKQC